MNVGEVIIYVLLAITFPTIWTTLSSFIWTDNCSSLSNLNDEGNLLALLNKGLAHHYIGQYNIVIKCFDTVLRVKPKNTTALHKASSFVKSGKIKEGLKILSEAIKLDFSFKEKAKLDIDFEDIKKINEFKVIIHTRF